MAFQNISKFNAGLALEPAIFDKKFKLLLQKVGGEVLRGVVLKTPVDTGRARGNWQVSVTSPPSTELNAVDRSGGGTIAEGLSKMSEQRGGNAIWIVNNLPYIEALESGHSRQAGPGVMVAATIEHIKTFLASGISF